MCDSPVIQIGAALIHTLSLTLQVLTDSCALLSCASLVAVFNVRTSEKQPNAITYIQAIHQRTPRSSCLRRVQHVLQLRGAQEPAEQMVKIPAASRSVSSR